MSVSVTVPIWLYSYELVVDSKPYPLTLVQGYVPLVILLACRNKGVYTKIENLKHDRGIKFKS
jgi:hypothetical protein